MADKKSDNTADNDDEEKVKVYETREYQSMLLEEAIKSNVILYLPTGSGKTYIAHMFIKHFGCEIEKPLKEGGKISFFICNTQALLNQQGKVLQRLLPFTVGCFSGANNVDFWSDFTWNNVLNTHQVFVVTAQILVDLLSTSRLRFDQINLIVFDECHHANNNHPMKKIADLYKLNKTHGSALSTRLMGLTATLLTGDFKTGKSKKSKEPTYEIVYKYIKEMEDTFCGKVICNDTPEVIKSSAKPTEEMRLYSNSGPSDEVNRMLKNINRYLNMISENELKIITYILNPSEFLSKPIQCPITGDLMETLHKKPCLVVFLKKISEEIRLQFIEHGLMAGHIVALMMMEEVIKEKLSVDKEHLLQLLQSVLTGLTHIRIKTRNIFIKLKDKNEKYKVYNTPKVNCLLKLLSDYDITQRTMIFCQRRVTVKMLYHFIKKLSKNDEAYKNIEVNFVVGARSSYLKTAETDFYNKIDKMVLHKFNKGEINVLIATNVLEEGIDIQACNLVIKFDLPENTRSYVQSKGRARSMGSKYIVIVNEDEKEKYLAKFNKFNKTEMLLKTVSKEISLERDEISEEPNDDKVEGGVYFVDGVNSACILESTSISLLYYYIGSLQVDYQSTVAPTIYKVQHANNGKTKRVIRMPSNCPIREDMHSDWFSDGKSAFRNVCFKTCIKLHQMGEITNNLKVSRIELNIEDFKDWVPNYKFLNNMENKKGVGTNKRKEVYPIECAKVLRCVQVMATDIYYMHVIKFKTNFEKDLVNTNSKKRYQEMVNSNFDFGFITNNKIDGKIIDFPIYERFGTINVHIIKYNIPIELNSKKINTLHYFHTYLFRQVFPLFLKSFLVTNYGDHQEDNTLILVPLMNSTTSNLEINWKWIKQIDEYRHTNTEMPLINEIEPDWKFYHFEDFKKEKYVNKVIIPWYRSNYQRDVYVVTGISKETPLSCFSESNQSYVDYYATRHNQTIKHKNQFLLEVKQITSNYNFLNPRSEKSTRQKFGAEFEELLLPELCNLVDFEADYWVKFVFLPTVLYRINNLLACEQFRTTTLENGKFPNPQQIYNDSVYLPLVKASDSDLVGKKPLITPLDMKSKGRTEVIKQIKCYQNIDNILNEDPHDEYSGLIDRYRELYKVSVFDICKCENDSAVSNTNQSEEESKKNNCKPYAINYIAPPRIKLLNKQFNNSFGPGQKDMFEAFMAHSANEIVNYERLETLGDSLLKFGSTLALFCNMKTFNEGYLTMIKGMIVGNKNLYLAAKTKNIPSILKVHNFIPSSDWVAPRFSVPKIVNDIFYQADIPPNVLYRINIPTEQMLDGDITQDKLNEIAEFLASVDDQDYLDPVKTSKRADKTPNTITTYNFLNKIELSDKTIADVVESLTGVYLKSYGVEGGLYFLQYLDVIPKEKANLQDMLYTKHETSKLSEGSIDPLTYIPCCSELEKGINYEFKDKSYLLEAITHPTFNQNRTTSSYQRLEFLGDAIIDFLITCYLYEYHTNLSPGQISDVRSALVNNVTFASYTVRTGLYKYLLYDSSSLYSHINKFVERQEARNHEISDEIFYLLTDEDILCENDEFDKQKCRISEQVDVPKALGDVFESIVGAIYIDSGKSLHTVWHFIYNIMRLELNKWSKDPPKNAIRMIYELNCLPEFSETEIIKNKAYVRLNLISPKTGERKLFHGIGTNKKNAKLAAAKIALRHIL